jgi:hypothetical protein
VSSFIAEKLDIFCFQNSIFRLWESLPKRLPNRLLLCDRFASALNGVASAFERDWKAVLFVAGDCKPSNLFNEWHSEVEFESAVKRIFKYIQSTDCTRSIGKSVVGHGK